MGNVRGVQFPNQKLTAADHRTVIAKSLGDGKISGCEITCSGSTATIGTGAFLISGGQVSITASESITVSQTSGYARLVAVIDLTGTATRTEWDQFSWRVDYAETDSGFEDLTQENINTGGGSVYELEFAVFALGSSGITDVVRELGEIQGGGGSVDWQTAIVHIYSPAGSTVTASKGGVIKTLRENQVSGSDSEYFLYVKLADYGSWELTATLGSDTATQTVTVESNVEYIIQLAYKLYLYNSGNEYSSTTGGWSACNIRGYGRVTFTKEDDYMQLETIGGSTETWVKQGCSPENLISKGAYSTLHFVYDQTQTRAMRVALATTKTDSSNESYFSGAIIDQDTTYGTDIAGSIDLSSVTVPFYLIFYYARGVAAQDGTAKIKSVYID